MYHIDIGTKHGISLSDFPSGGREEGGGVTGEEAAEQAAAIRACVSTSVQHF